MTPTPDPAAAVLARLDTQDDVCGSGPPEVLVDTQGNVWTPGDCWCTLPPRHDGQCLCEVCTARYNTPGWPSPEETP